MIDEELMVMPYDLEDKILIDNAAGKSTAEQSDMMQFQFMAFVPAETSVILGQSNSTEMAINKAACKADKIKVMKRPSGGETVLISPKTMIISFSIMGRKIARSAVVFSFALQNIAKALLECNVAEPKHRGISDLVLNGKKILGCAIYRKTGMLLYHAVLNIAEDPANIGKYLLHPGREPDYRKGRSHEEFVTSLYLEGYDIDPVILKQKLQVQFLSAWSSFVSDN